MTEPNYNNCCESLSLISRKDARIAFRAKSKISPCPAKNALVHKQLKASSCGQGELF